THLQADAVDRGDVAEADGDPAGVDRRRLQRARGLRVEDQAPGRELVGGRPLHGAPATGGPTPPPMPALNIPCGSSTRTFTPKTWCRRSSTLCTFRGVNSLIEATWMTFPRKRLFG